MANERGVFRIKGEHSWEIRGDEALVADAFNDLRGVGRRVHPELIHLDFGNAVGVFRVRGLGTIEVVSGKWDEAHFNTMMADVARIASQLPFAAGTPGPLPYDRSLAAQDDLLYHAFVYIRHILSESAPREVRLLPSLNAILAEPHRRIERRLVEVPIEMLERIDADTVDALVSANGPTIEAACARLPALLQGRVPRRVAERQSLTTIDTPENRFVKTFLDMVLAVLGRMKQRAANESAFSARIRTDCRELEKLVAPIRRHPLWRDVKPMVHLPTNSTVLQRRRGYRHVFRHFILLRLATRHLPISAHDARDLLESKDIATLYELWCYFRVVDLLTELLRAPVSAMTVDRDDIEARIKHEFAVKWSCGVHALYNATFSPRRKDEGRKTYSLPLRPDVVVILPNGDVHVLDAKFKLDWIDPGDDDDVDRATVKLADVYKMHTYRDAIERAQSAWVLYPGTERRTFTPRGASETEGVGAVPLRPEDGGGRDLREHLERILGPLIANTP